jgi:hypothetical protein
MAWNAAMNFGLLVIARSAATKQSSWIAAVGFASLAMTNGKVHQQRSEESSGSFDLVAWCGNPSGFVAPLLMNAVRAGCLG